MPGYDRDPLKALRARAYELAETGRYAGWKQVERALQAEDFQMPGGEQRGAKLFRELVTARCQRARSGKPLLWLATLQANG